MNMNASALERSKKLLAELYEKYACVEADIPLFADAKLYEKYKGMPDSKYVKLLDRRGNVRVIRPDATFHVLSNINKADVRSAQRLYYVTEIVRAESAEILEMPETGAEFFNDSSPLCDCEVISLAEESLEVLNINRYRVDIGHSEFIGALFADEKNLSEEAVAVVNSYIAKKNALDLEDFLKEQKVSPKLINAAIEMCMLFGDCDSVFSRAHKLAFNDGMKDALNSLTDIVKLLMRRTDPDRIFLDLGFANRRDYYSGMIFKIYAENASQEVISGGRYDRLASRLGHKKSACGFGHYLELTLPIAEFKNNNKRLIDISAPKSMFEKAADEAVRYRKKGYSVSLNESAEKLSIRHNSKIYSDFSLLDERIIEID